MKLVPIPMLLNVLQNIASHLQIFVSSYKSQIIFLSTKLLRDATIQTITVNAPLIIA